jgi:hypothetical protein
LEPITEMSEIIEAFEEEPGPESFLLTKEPTVDTAPDGRASAAVGPDGDNAGSLVPSPEPLFPDGRWEMGDFR